MSSDSTKAAMSDRSWWVGARLYRQGHVRQQLVTSGVLAELVWLALDAEPSDQEALTIKVEPDGEILSASEWQALTELPDFPVCI